MLTGSVEGVRSVERVEIRIVKPLRNKQLAVAYFTKNMRPLGLVKERSLPNLEI